MYSIDSQSPSEAFSIDGTSGELTLSQRVDYEVTKDYLVVVKATDQALDQRKRRSALVTSR